MDTSDNHNDNKRTNRTKTRQTHGIQRRTGGETQVTFGYGSREGETQAKLNEATTTISNVVESGDLTESQEKTLNVAKWILNTTYDDEDDEGEEEE